MTYTYIIDNKRKTFKINNIYSNIIFINGMYNSFYTNNENPRYISQIPHNAP